jgi:16S rRNA pseudouridine516 synthase
MLLIQPKKLTLPNRIPEMSNRKGTLAALLAEQGFGTRKECGRLVWAGLVKIGYFVGEQIEWRTPDGPDEQVIPEGLQLQVDDIILPYLKNLHLVLHKPINTECSHTPSHHQSIFALLPEPFINRGIEAVGRLDADTTGLLLLSDSGPFNHFFTSPKRHISKTYRVGTKHLITPEQKSKLEAGVDLKADDETTLPAKVTMLSETSCDMTLQEGRYHQVKRMFGAVGNRVESIHRVTIGSFALEDSLVAGQWRILTPEDLLALGYLGA